MQATDLVAAARWRGEGGGRARPSPPRYTNAADAGFCRRRRGRHRAASTVALGGNSAPGRPWVHESRPPRHPSIRAATDRVVDVALDDLDPRRSSARRQSLAGVRARQRTWLCPAGPASRADRPPIVKPVAPAPETVGHGRVYPVSPRFGSGARPRVPSVGRSLGVPRDVEHQRSARVIRGGLIALRGVPLE